MVSSQTIKPRNFGNVVQAIYEQVPESESGFRKELRDLLESFPYNAPELSEIGGVLWTRLSYLVHDYVNKPQTKTFEELKHWEQQVLLVLSGRK